MGKYKNFIRDAYSGKHLEMCNEWKELIIEEFPELIENELEVGKWYILETPKSKRLFYFESIKYNSRLGYGFNLDDNTWDGSFNFSLDFDDTFKRVFTPATEKEVETALIKEAKRRGFNEKARFKHSSFHPELKDKINTVGNGDTYFDREDNFLLFNGWEIFNNGKWAEIIETITKEEAEKKLGCKILD